jgi:hypothetical protein
MACNITTGRAKACKEFLGGVQSLFLFNFVENAFTVVDGEATAINPLLTEVFEFKVEGDGQTLVEDMVPSRNEGTTVNTQTITAMLKGIDADTSANLNLLAKGWTSAVVRDRNGVYHAVGLDDAIDFTVNQATGGAKTDMNGYTLTGVSTTKAFSPKLDSATITAFLALVD